MFLLLEKRCDDINKKRIWLTCWYSKEVEHSFATVTTDVVQSTGLSFYFTFDRCKCVFEISGKYNRVRTVVSENLDKQVSLIIQHFVQSKSFDKDVAS